MSQQCPVTAETPTIRQPRALWRFAVRPRWSRPQPDDIALHLVCPLCDWAQRIEPFGPDELGALLRVAFGHLESAHEAEA